MAEEIAEIAVLDYVIFHLSYSDNSYQTLICSNGIIEKLACGPLDQLAVHLSEARASSHFKRSHVSFKLQLDESAQSSSWFNKFTVERFLHIVNAPNILKLAHTVENEISQLEETRRFHIALYAKDHLHNSGVGAADISCMDDVGLTQQVKVETASSDATKNELLRALDLRLTALKEDLAASFNRVVGATCSSSRISDLASFTQQFGAIELRNFLLRVLELCPNNLSFDTSTKHQRSLNELGNINNERSFSPFGAKPDVVIPATSSVSPAKVAQAERQSSSESEGCSDSSDGDSSTERSRPVVRSATPRRSASPMRRIQIGRSGSRRSAALTIKSLNYHPVRDRAVSNRDVGASENEDNELERLTKKPETNVVRMSVQDAISLFESKQKDQKADIHNRKASEVSISANKSVLRRWSSGMGDSFNCATRATREKASDFVHQIATSNLDSETLEKEDEVKAEVSNPENAPAVVYVENRITPLYVTIPSETVVSSEGVDSKDRLVTAEWNRQKEAELNEMLMKMRESSKPTKYRNAKGDFDGLKDKPIDTRGGFYSQYKEKRDEKLRAENAINHAAKEAQLKVMHETLEQSKSAMASKTVDAAVKCESANISQKPRRNSSPPVISKKEVSKSTSSSKKVYSKSSSAPQTRSSLPSGPSKKMDGTRSGKSSPAVSTSSTPIRRRSLPSSFPAQPSLRTEKSLEHMTVNKKASSIQTDMMPSFKGQEDKKLKAVKKNGKALNPTIPLSGEGCGTLSSKPSFQNKYTKKSSVVPLESKPFLKKGSGISAATGHSIAKAKETRISKSIDSLNNSGNLVQTEENESNPAPAGSIIKVIEDYLVQPTNVVDETLAAPFDNDMNIETADTVDGSLTRVDTDMGNSLDPLIEEIQHDEDLGISSAAWVEEEHREYSPSCNIGQQAVVSSIIAPVVSSSSRVRHSLSQMLQSDSSEPEIIIEWGNAENPPSLVYQKDSPKGLKRLLKFTRKGKGEGNLTGCSSPSAFSEGEEEHEESIAANKRTSDARPHKASLQSKGYGQPKSLANESLVGLNSSKSAMDYRMDRDVLSGSDKPRDGHISIGVTATKATRSFFSLSSFRSGKSSEAKLR